jgi:hypothetical protein
LDGVTKDRALSEHLCVELLPGLDVAQVYCGRSGDLPRAIADTGAAANEK